MVYMKIPGIIMNHLYLTISHRKLPLFNHGLSYHGNVKIPRNMLPWKISSKANRNRAFDLTQCVVADVTNAVPWHHLASSTWKMGISERISASETRVNRESWYILIVIWGLTDVFGMGRTKHGKSPEGGFNTTETSAVNGETSSMMPHSDIVCLFSIKNS